MKLTPLEQETILNFSEGEDTASLYTYNKKLQRRFDMLAAEHPEAVSRKENGHGAVTYEFSKKPLGISFQRPLSKAEQQRRREQVAQFNLSRKASVAVSEIPDTTPPLG